MEAWSCTRHHRAAGAGVPTGRHHQGDKIDPPRTGREPWRWYHRWWVTLGGILLALIVGALAIEYF
jgi:hypothetical protein